MVIAFQVVLFITLLLGVMGAIGERENENLRTSMTSIAIASIIALLITFFVL